MAAMRARTAQVAFRASSPTEPVRKNAFTEARDLAFRSETRAGCPATTSAASMRMELLPMSMAA